MRILSDKMMKALNAQETGEAILALITIDYPTLSQAIRVTSDNVMTPSNGNEFQPLPFRYMFPDQTDEGNIESRLEVDNIHRDMVKAVREATVAPTVTTQFVLGSTPDVVEMSLPNFRLRGATYNKLTIEGRLLLESPATLPYPGHIFTPSNTPGIF